MGEWIAASKGAAEVNPGAHRDAPLFIVVPSRTPVGAPLAHECVLTRWLLLSELIKINAITQGSVSFLTRPCWIVPRHHRRMLIVIALPFVYCASVTFSTLSSSGKYTDRRSKCNPACGHVQCTDPPLFFMPLQRKNICLCS